MSYVFLLHFDQPYRSDLPARHYLEYTARRIEDRVNDHYSGARYRTTGYMYAVANAGITVTVARVWANATRRDERLLRNLKNNPRLCPICNPSLNLKTVAYTRTTDPHDFTGEISTLKYWRTYGSKTAYGALETLHDRPLRPARVRVRRDGTRNTPPNHTDTSNAHVPFDAHTLPDGYTPFDDYVMLNGRRYDIDVFGDVASYMPADDAEDYA